MQPLMKVVGAMVEKTCLRSLAMSYIAVFNLTNKAKWVDKIRCVLEATEKKGPSSSSSVHALTGAEVCLRSIYLSKLKWRMETGERRKA